MSKRVLVTGSNGQLGKSLQKIVSKNNTNIAFTFATRDLLDISNTKEIESYFKENTFDFCVNCAAYTAVDKAEEEQEQAFLINAEAVKLLAENCRQNNVVLIHISTDFVFDGAKNEPYNETDLTNPLSAYGNSKLQGETYIKETLDTFFIIRTSWVYSEYGSNFVKTMLHLAKERDEISVVNDQIGCPTYAQDLAELILEIISKGSTYYGLYHFCNQGVLSWYEFAKHIIDIKGLQCDVNPILSKDFKSLASRPKYSVLSVDKTFSTFNELKSKNVLHSLKNCLQNI